MNAYVSTELSMIQMLDPQRHELALLQEAFLNKGGTIEVLQGPSFVPPPVRHEPPPTVKAKPVTREPEKPNWLDKMAMRDIEREERAMQRAKERTELIERIRISAETMTYAQAVLRLGMSRRNLQKIAVENDFKFQPAITNNRQSYLRGAASEEKHAKDAERIKAFREIGLSRNQAMIQLGVTFRTFTMLLEKFDIDYPKAIRGPHPAFFPKSKEATQ